MNFTLKTMILVRLNVTEGWNLTAAVQMQVKKLLKNGWQNKIRVVLYSGWPLDKTWFDRGQHDFGKISKIKQKSSWQTKQHMINYQSCRVWDNRSDKTDWEKNFQKMKKVLDKTDLIRYNKRAVAENDNKTKNLDNWTVK